MHLTATFLNWYVEDDMGGMCEETNMHRAYEIWRHARDRISHTPTELDCIDAIGALRRAVNHRLKAIRAAYNFDFLPSPHAKKQTLERLQEYGIVRPALIKDLLEVRNLIEHEDSEPPAVERCHHFVDIIWYFLRSTDKLFDMRVDSIRFLSEDSDNEVLLYINHAAQWSTRLKGTVRAEMISIDPGTDTLSLTNYSQEEVEGRPGVLEISGNALFSPDQLIRLGRSYFAASGYWYDDHV